jgi:hypothetical protein
VVVDYFHVVRMAASPAKTDSPLVVDTNAVLPAARPAQFFQPIGRRNPKISERTSRIEDQQLSQRDSLDAGKPLGVPPLEDFLSFLATEPLDHGLIITHHVNIVKRYQVCLTC